MVSLPMGDLGRPSQRLVKYASLVSVWYSLLAMSLLTPIERDDPHVLDRRNHQQYQHHQQSHSTFFFA